MDHLRRFDPLYTENMRERGIVLVSSMAQVKKMEWFIELYLHYGVCPQVGRLRRGTPVDPVKEPCSQPAYVNAFENGRNVKRQIQP